MATNSVEICNNALTLIGTRRITALGDPSKEARACNDNYEICRKAVLRMHPWNFAETRVELTGVAVSAIVDNGAGLIKVTTATAHGLSTGNRATVSSVVGTSEANQTGVVTVIDATNFTFDGSTFENVYVSGGLVSRAPAFEFEHMFALPSGFMRVCTVKDVSDNVLAATEYRIEGQYLLTGDETVRLFYVANVTTTTLFDPLFDELLAAYLADKIAFKITGSESTQERCSRYLKQKMQASRFVDSVENPSEVLDSDEWIRARWSTNQGYVRDPMT